MFVEIVPLAEVRKGIKHFPASEKANLGREQNSEFGGKKQDFVVAGIKQNTHSSVEKGTRLEK